MKIISFLLFVCCLQAAGRSYSQKVTLNVENVPVQKVFTELSRQTGISIVFSEAQMNGLALVTVHVKDATIQEALDLCMKNQPLNYKMEDGLIVVSKDLSNSFKSLSGPPPPIKITGRVVDENGNGVSNASVMVKGTKKGTSTDYNGGFTIFDVDDNAMLVISGINIKNQEVAVEGKALHTISVKAKVKEEEEVVVAYNRISAKNNIGAITVVKGEQIKDLPSRSFDRSLQGMVPGLLVTKPTGQPGGGVGSFVLRGISTSGDLGSGATARYPLVVIDGIPVQHDGAQLRTTPIIFNNPMAQLNPSDIEEITVLKDAAAIALYGTKASNGVILVTTKKGRAGKTTYNFRHQTDISSLEKGQIKTLNQEEYLELVYETYKNTNPDFWTDARIKSDLIKKFPYKVSSPGDTSFYPAPDWQSELYAQTAATISNEISVSGGNDKHIYYFNLEYLNQDGIEKKTGFDRVSLRFNYENKPIRWLKHGINSTFSYSKQLFNATGSSYQLLTTMSPLNAIRNMDGEYIYNYSWGVAPASNLNTNGNLFANPAAAAQLNINRNISYRGLTKLYLEATILKDFVFSINLGANFALTEALEKVHPLLATGGSPLGKGMIYERQLRYGNIINTNLLRYTKQLGGRHNLNVFLGHEAQMFNNKSQEVKNDDISSTPNVDQPNTGLAYGFGSTAKQRMLSYFGQFNYNYSSKYFFTASNREDGSSLFGRNNSFGNHWSSGIGWMISEENFLKNRPRPVNYLKVRGSVGSAGNSSSTASSLKNDILLSDNYLSHAVVLPNINTPPGNPSIRWEKTFSWDAGLEAGLFNNRLGITVDIYNRKTTDLISYDINLPMTTGFNTITANVGDIVNKGIELSFNLDIIKNKKFRWNLAGNWSKNTNELTKSNVVSQRPVGGGLNIINEVGKNYNSFKMVKWAGVDPENGRPLWYDSTGKPSSNYNAAKPELVGKPQPDGFGAITNAISYKGFEFSFMLYFQYGFQILDTYQANSVLSDGRNPYINQTRNALNRWQKPGDIAENPRRLLFGRTTAGADNSSNISTRYLYDGDFVKLSNVKLAYTIPSAVLNRLKVSSIKIFIQGNNLKTWTKFPGYDPETIGTSGTTAAPYPLQKIYSFGANILF